MESDTKAKLFDAVAMAVLAALPPQIEVRWWILAVMFVAGALYVFSAGLRPAGCG